MRNVISVFALVLFLAPLYATAETIYGCDFDADGTEDAVESRRCVFSEDLQRTVCSKLVVTLSSDNKVQKINFKKSKARAKRGYSDFVCMDRADSDGTDLFATNKRNKINQIKKIRNSAYSNLVAGLWLIEKEGTYSFWRFREDGTFIKKRAGESLNGITHFEGTYSINENAISGDFTNPGVGRGEIEGVINKKDKFLMDFIEYWHTPRKVVPCVGVRQ